MSSLSGAGLKACFIWDCELDIVLKTDALRTLSGKSCVEVCDLLGVLNFSKGERVLVFSLAKIFGSICLLKDADA